MRSVDLASRLFASVVLVATAACSAPTEQSRNAPPAQREATPVQNGEQPESDLKARAVKALSEHLSVPPESIEVVSITPVEWRDSSLGCPKPDRAYLPVVRPGHRAVLRYEGRLYAVHMSAQSAFVCEQKPVAGTPKPGPTPIETLPRKQLELLARTDLANRLQVELDEVKLIESRPVVWTDSSLGCPKSQAHYESTRHKGYVIELEHAGRRYTYHTDMARVLPCPPIDRK